MNPQFLQALMQALGVRPPQNQALDRVAAQGRGGDTMLAHINPREAEMLKEAGGSGTINPKTGLPEFADALGGGGSTGGGGAALGGGTSAGGDAGLSAANSNTLGGFSFGGVSPVSNPSTGFDAVNSTPGTPPDAPTSGEKLAGTVASMGLSGLLNAVVPGAGTGVGLLSGASGLLGGTTLSSAIAQSLADHFGGNPQAASMTNQGGINLGASNATSAPQGSQSGGLDAYQPGYLPQATNPAAATPGVAATPTAAELDLAKRGFYTTPQTASLVQPSSAIDPVLQSAMLYARG